MSTPNAHDDVQVPPLWRALYYFNIYRLMVGVAFVAIGVSGGEYATLGQRYPSLFAVSSVLMVAVAGVSLYTITRARPRFELQGILQFTSDAVLITLLTHASGGVTSGIYLLLLVSVAASGIVLSGRISLFLAALGAVLALIEHGISYLKYHPWVEGTFTQVGILGVALFATSIMINVVVSRMKTAEAEARKSGADLAKLSRLNELVVANLDAGILVTDWRGNIQLWNERARGLLGLENADTLAQASAPLHQRMLDWKAGDSDDRPIRSSPAGPNVVSSFTRVSEGPDTSVVIFLEDVSRTEERAHHLKLAALGRLTSAVAHEIRNPLGAIGHAGQLMRESADLSATSRRLVEIINQQTDRVNAVIKSILELSRPQRRKALLIDLDEWLENFRTVFRQTHAGDDALELRPTGQQVIADPDHLHQILTNLCENGLRYGASGKVVIEGGRLETSGRPYLDVVNDGPAIAADIREKIFEPFFTTGAAGTGLGLYLARELCQDNNAQLDCLASQEGSRFRIRFARTAHAAA